ncbi:MAG: Ppx/GppA family phosphatase [Bacteroidales bacterium]|nr:Ppx/GppA family phosphatase [Bacteroidales bacterium]
MLFASIDIGSNAGRLLVATVLEYKGHAITDKVTLVRVPLRLGIDVFEKGEISYQREELLINTLKAYKQLIAIYNPIDFVACATSAMRHAKNGSSIIDRIKKETDINLNIIDGLTEAKIISEAGNVDMHKPYPYSLYIDVGGGSSELSWYKNDSLIAVKSFKIGTIRELYNLTQKQEWDALKNWLADLNINGKEINCICSGGNINKLTKLYGSKHQNLLSYQQLNKGLKFLKSHTIEDRISLLGLRKDRADVIVPAAIIFKQIMKWSGIKELHSPKIGLADGLIVELYKKHKGFN